jgi:hypothetical protein
MDALPYWKMVFREVARRISSHLRQKLVFWILTSMMLAAIQYLLQVRSLSDTMKIAISIGASAGIVLLFSFVKALVQVPPSLCSEPKKRTPSEEHYVQMVKDAVTRHGDHAVTLLRHLKLMGAIVFGFGAAPSLPDGMNHSETLELLKLLKAEKIVYDEFVPVDMSSPLARTMAPDIWHISPGIEPLLDEILYP